MDNLASVNPDELPDGYSISDPNARGPQKSTEAQQKELQKQAVLEQALTSDALARLRRIKLVKSDKITAVENLIVSMAMQGKLPERVNEGKLIEMLENIGSRKANAANSEIKIQRKRYAFDSDDDDDNDDDLM